MSWIDMVASMAAQRHACTEVVTASIDSLNFKHPIHIGDHAILKASVNYVGTTSMEVGVRVLREDPKTNVRVITTTAHLTFVALDDDRNPTPVPLCIWRPKMKYAGTPTPSFVFRTGKNCLRK